MCARLAHAARGVGTVKKANTLPPSGVLARALIESVCSVSVRSSRLAPLRAADSLDAAALQARAAPHRRPPSRSGPYMTPQPAPDSVLLVGARG